MCVITTKPNGGIVLPNPRTRSRPDAGVTPPRVPRGPAAGTIRTGKVSSSTRRMGLRRTRERFLCFGNTKTCSSCRHQQVAPALAGMRIGYALGSGDIISTLGKFKINRPGTIVHDGLHRTGVFFWCRKVSTTRDRSAEALRALGFTVLPSLTNFLFVTHPEKGSAGYLRRPARKGYLLSAISSCRALIITCVLPSAQMSRWIS